MAPLQGNQGESMGLHKNLVLGAALFASSTLASSAATASNRHFEAGSLIIPTDNAYQGAGIYQAYGLLYQLLKQGVTVYWVIAEDKVWHHAPCNTVGDECDWDCAEEGSGVKCPYPTASPDFYVGADVLWSDVGDAAGTTISNHGYRSGPFIIDSADRDAAIPIINAWNDQNEWTANPWAERSVFKVVSAHEANAAFQGFVSKKLIAAPSIAVFADGNEKIANEYLRNAGIPQSNGSEFPDAKCGDVTCGPNSDNPDMLTVPSVAGDMGTCDAPNADHKNGALFKANGEPAFCQIMSMHWGVNDRELVECNGGACPNTPEECAGEPITYHGHEVVAEVRSFLAYPTHFFAECQAVNAYENTVPNPDWPYLDDEGRMGHFLTTTGTPPPCPCNPGPGEGEFECVVDGCGAGQDCCLPKDNKEKGAGFMIADQPDPYKFLRPDVAYAQFDGAFEREGGSEPAYNLSTYLGTQYKNDRDVTFITAMDGPGIADVWMTGYVDGACDVNDTDDDVGGSTTTTCGGKVSYLGGHSYVGKNGQRLFLNALFEADCVTNANWPHDDGGGNDSDGDGISDANDPFPNDGTQCGDSDNDGCDDCSSGSFSPANDGQDSDGDGICDAADDEPGAPSSSGGCGCRASGSTSSTLGLLLLVAFVLRRRRVNGL
jgi:MYXO-CTERM domain-containing protein